MRLAQSLAAVREVVGNRNMRWLQLAGAFSVVGSWAYIVALAVYAYDAGGATAVGLVGFVRLLPSAIATPFAALLADRFPRVRVMVASDLTRATALALAAGAVFADLPAGVVYVLAAIAALAATPFEPAERALFPSLARSADELVAANAVASTVGSTAVLAGPALGGVVLAATSAGVVFAGTAATLVASAFSISRIDVRGDPVAAAKTESVGRAAFAGFRAIALDARLRVLLGLYSVATIVVGILDVLVVPTALRLFDLGSSGVGYFFAVIGVGGVVGGAVAIVLSSRRRLGADFALGMILFGTPIALLGTAPPVVLALGLLVVLGIANTLVGVACTSLLQRTVPSDVLGRVFGVEGMVVTATVAVGSIVAPALIALLGVRGALVATGVAPPVAALALWRPLARIDAAAEPRGDELRALESVEMLSVLPASTLEALAAHVEAVDVAAGTEVVRRGDRGDRFFVIASGDVCVDVPGAEEKRLGRGDYFGEIALLRDVHRTATVRATSAARLYAVDGDAFVAAVTGHPPSAEAADAAVSALVGSTRTSIESL